MKVLFYSYAYPNPVQPGLGTFNRTMIAGLAADHDVQVVSPVSFTDVWKARLTGGLPHGLNNPRFAAVPGVPAEYLTYYYSPKLLRSQYGRWMWWSVQRRLDRTMKSFRPDVVLSYWAHPDGEVAVRMAHRHGIPAIAMVGGSDVLLLGRSGSRQQKILDVLNNADGVATVSENIADTLVNDGLDPHKLHIVRRGVDRAMFSPGDRMVARRGLAIPKDTALLISVGRLVPVKGHCYLLQACRLLAARRVPFRCYILGDGPLRTELQNQIRDLGLEGCVELRGSQSQSQLVEWYRAADVTVLTSLSEGVPNVLLESISCGTPFVATDVGGVPEIADSRHDRVVPHSSPVALADAIEWQLKVRREALPARLFEPLGLRAAALRLTNVMEEVCEKAQVSSKWIKFRLPHLDHVNGVPSHQLESARSVQNSLPAVSAAMEAPVVLAESEYRPRDDRPWRGKVYVPPNLYSDELGRTGEEFVLPKP